MKNLRNAFLGLGLAGAAVLGQASPIFLDFEGIADNISVADFYNGGGGTNYGVSFSSGVAQVDSDAGGSGDIANEPSPSTVLLFLDGTQSSFLNYAPGFNTSVSFFYSSVTDTNVKVYTELNGGGSLLGSIALTSQFDLGGCNGDPTGTFCNFTLASLSFTGTAKSIDFGDTLNQVAFDNITLNTDALPPDNGGGNNKVPEPHTLALMGLALAGMGAVRRHKPVAGRDESLA